MLNDTLIQIALGLVPVMFTFLFFGTLAKKRKEVWFIISGTFFVLALIIGLPRAISIGSSSSDPEYDRLNLIYAVANKGDPELAMTLLEELQGDYTPDLALACARLSVLNGDYGAAKALYLKTLPIFPEAEREYTDLVELINAEKEFYAVTDNINAQDLSFLRSEKREKAVNTILSSISTAIPPEEISTYERAAEMIVYTDGAYNAFLSNEYISQEELERETRRFNVFLSNNSEFLSNSSVRMARLKLQMLTGDYRGIAENIDELSDYHELLIASELYLSNYIDRSYFSSEFSGSNIRKYEVVYNKLRDIYNNNLQNKPRHERESARMQLGAMQLIVRNPALGKIQEGLLRYATSEFALDASKVFLQLAKIEHSLGNDSRFYYYMDRSIDTVGDCRDMEFAVPMFELVGIITDQDDVERLRNAAVYVQEVLDNTMTVKIEPTGPPQPPSADPDDMDSFADDFSTQMQTYVNQKRMSVNIVRVDTSGFNRDNTVAATINVSNHLYSSLEELERAITIRDCGVNITDFTIEKVEYAAANILLCVDVSGSMQGYKIDDLVGAVRLFADEITPVENISLVTFNNGIVNDYPFGMTASELLNAANNIYAGGGTAIYHSTIHSISKFSNNPGEINSIILMSDGIDGYRAGLDEIETYIAGPAREKGITIYAIGFGSDADNPYLSSIATSTGGSYLYAFEPQAQTRSNQLSDFFNLLRSQILNQYTITFKAQDTLTYARELRINVGTGLDGDRVMYYLGGGADSMIDTDYNEDSPVFMNGKAVYGFDPRLLFKNGRTMNTVLRGEGFASDDTINISLKGNTTGVSWDVGTAFESSDSVTVTIPAGIAVDVYDVYITINGKTAILPGGLSIFNQGSERVTDFGEYRFVSYLKHEDKARNTVTLSGHVTMNGWLNFNGDVSLTGNLNGSSITLSDWHGSKVRYEQQDAEGLAGILAELGLPVYLPPIGMMTLYNDLAYERQTGDFRVEVTPINAFDIGKYFMMSSIDMKLYPNRMTFDAHSIAATLPLANNILRNKADLFSFDCEFSGIISAQSVGVRLEVKYEPGKSLSETFLPISLGNMPLSISPQDTELLIDTYANIYAFKFMVKAPFLGDSALGFSARWDGSATNNGLVPTELKLYADIPKTVMLAQVPITFDDFMIGVEDIDVTKSPLHWTFVGGCDISAAKITALPGLTGLSAWIGDVSVLKLDDVRLSFNLGNRHIKASATLKAFEDLDLGYAQLDLGQFSYNNILLNMNDETVSGLRFLGKIERDWWLGGNSSVSMSIDGEFNAHSRFIGIRGEGSFDLNLKLWVISINPNFRGELAIGIWVSSNGEMAFIIRTDPKIPGVGEITWPKNMAGKV